MNKNNSKQHVITAICLMGIAVAMISFFTLLTAADSPGAANEQRGLPVLCMNGIASLVCAAGLWKMKKWSLMVYIVWALARQFFEVQTMGAVSLLQLGGDCVIIAFILSVKNDLS